MTPHDLGILVLVGVFELACVLLPAGLRRSGRLSREWARSWIHAGCGLGLLAVPFLDQPWWAVLVAGIATVGLSRPAADAAVARWLHGAIAEAEEESLGYLEGLFVYALSITLLAAVIALDGELARPAIACALVMMYADPAAGVVGRRFGRHRVHVPWVGSKRSLEGSVAFFVVALVVAAGTLSVASDGLPWLRAFGVAVASTMLELASPSKLDDLYVPIGTIALIALEAWVTGP